MARTKTSPGVGANQALSGSARAREILQASGTRVDCQATQAPIVCRFHVQGQVADREVPLLAVALNVHLRHAGDDANAAVDAGLPFARSNAAIVRLAGSEFAMCSAFDSSRAVERGRARPPVNE